MALQDARGEITFLLDQLTNGLNELQRCKAQIGVLVEERERVTYMALRARTLKPDLLFNSTY